MSRIAALGEEPRVAGLAVAGVDVIAAGDAAEVVDAWERLGADTAVVILTPASAAILGARLRERATVLSVVMPP